MISEIKSFVDEYGKRIIARVPLTGACDVCIKTTYIGAVGAQYPIYFEFPEGLTLEECFDKFDEYAQKVITKMREENQITIKTIHETSLPWLLKVH
jgi:hypothetical protein